MTTFTIQIPESNWRPIDEAARDGRLVWLRDDDGNVDLAQWSRGEWNAELGTVSNPSACADVSIVGYTNHKTKGESSPTEATDDNTNDEKPCGEPCHPDYRCDNCSEYWHRMESEGYWKNKQWTDKGWREIVK